MCDLGSDKEGGPFYALSTYATNCSNCAASGQRDLRTRGFIFELSRWFQFFQLGHRKAETALAIIYRVEDVVNDSQLKLSVVQAAALQPQMRYLEPITAQRRCILLPIADVIDDEYGAPVGHGQSLQVAGNFVQ